MKTKFDPLGQSSGQRPAPTRAFSLIEIMVAVGLLSFIILGLLAVFSQTQRAFRASLTQTDVLEGGRSVMDLLSRELEQATPSRYADFFDRGVRYSATNFFVEISNFGDPLTQDLPGMSTPRPKRVNIVDRFYFLTHVNQDWIGTGYQVVYDDPNGWVGSLYRFSRTNQFRNGPFTASAYFRPDLSPTNMSRIADGIVHLRVRPLAANGFPIVSDGAHTYGLARTNAFLPADEQSLSVGYGVVPNVFTFPNRKAPDRMLGCYFFNSAMPAAVEIEIGILEPRILQRYKSIPPGVPAARQYLADHAAEVHLFRQRIPIRNADLSLFP